LAIWTFEHFIVKTKGHRKKDKRTPQKGQKDTAKRTKGHRKKDKRTPQKGQKDTQNGQMDTQNGQIDPFLITVNINNS
jgi:hypothetical protein